METSKMPHMIFCQKLQKEAPAMDEPPFPGDLGCKIHENISQPGWELWVAHQTMLINEHRLNALDASSQEFLLKEMNQFLFG
jgi:Fe-S cluster biosynthesis and repair protein YggX